MENVPWHHDVKAFAEALMTRTKGEYELSCEHQHSCCVLLANADKFKVQGQWFTWIDYERFHDLVSFLCAESLILSSVFVACHLCAKNAGILEYI